MYHRITFCLLTIYGTIRAMAIRNAWLVRHENGNLAPPAHPNWPAAR